MSKTHRVSIETIGRDEGSLEPGSCVIRPTNVREGSRRWIFVAAWRTINVLLVLTFVSSIYCVGWEFSMRRYLRGFADAVIPAQGTPEEKIEAILYWMSTGPARLPAGPNALAADRDPAATLNYQALLTVCGTATNAFINLADSSGLTARRLLLLDSDRLTKHVVAEVLIGNRWVVVDPTFRFIPRGPDGRMLTRLDLTDQAVLEEATKHVRGYDTGYTYDRTAHVRVSRLGPFGAVLRRFLNTLGRGWEDSATTSLLLERQSFAAAVLSVLFFFLLLIGRAVFRWIGEVWLGLHPVRFRDQIRRAAQAFLEPAS